MDKQTKVTGVILAGGLARRMNQRDKGLIQFKGQALVSYAITAMGKVTDKLAINANRNMGEYQRFGLPVISDQTDSFDGPLAGVLTAMIFADPGILLIMPCDSPFFKAEHLNKLQAARAETDADVAVAFDGKQLHPVFLAIKTTLRSSLQNYLLDGQRKVDLWLGIQNMVKVDFSSEPDIFININTLNELDELESKT
jgi:molybdopterin-guanine dinucleotide biosynthesis protein A